MSILLPTFILPNREVSSRGVLDPAELLDPVRPARLLDPVMPDRGVLEAAIEIQTSVKTERRPEMYPLLIF